MVPREYGWRCRVAVPSSLPSELSPLREGDPEYLGPYRMVGRLGVGGMGAVFGGLDGEGRCLAVKTLHGAEPAEPAMREAFVLEAALLVRVKGECVPRVHAADPEGPVPWLATDFVPGRTLRRHVNEIGALDGAMLVAFAAGAAEALAAIHACGVVHRAIKPGNVILSPHGPKVVDFGIATGTDQAEGPDVTSSYGTPGWVAPERPLIYFESPNPFIEE
jgi:eukaryotic-like serine/threonine-protein kinase